LLVASIPLDPLDIFDRGFHHRGHSLVHRVWIVAFDEKGRPAAAAQKLFQFLTLNASEAPWDC